MSAFDQFNSKPQRIIQTVADWQPSSSPFGSKQEDRVIGHGEYIAKEIKREEDALLREMRGNRKTFSAILFEAMKEIEREERESARVEAANKAAHRTHEMMLDRIGKRGERSKLNDYLKSFGYRWQSIDHGSEDDVLPDGYGAGIGEYSHSSWALIAPDGSATSVRRAMEEIGKSL